MSNVDQLWMMVSIFLVFLIIPGVSFFHGGFVRSKYSLSAILKSFIVLGPTSLLWVFFGHHLVLGDLSSIGSLEYLTNDIGNSLISFFNLFLSLIAITIVSGAVVERIRFNFWILFSIFWTTLVYYPIARWTINDTGWLKSLGIVDFGSGLAVHVTSGVSALIIAKQLGRRIDFFKLRKSFNLALVFVGVSLISVGWIGFNGGSALAFNSISIQAVQNTFLSLFVGVTTWMLMDLLFTPHKVTGKGVAISIICSLVAITPGAGVLSASSAILVGLISTFICYLGVKYFYKVVKIDDSCEVFVSHGIAGIFGTLLTPFFMNNNFVLQSNVVATLVTVSYSLVVTYILVFVLQKILKFRVSSNIEERGLDITQHGENIIVIKNLD